MRFSKNKLMAEAEATGFASLVLEKTALLLMLLERLNQHPFLKGKLALKGGTALNLFLFEVPRLSIDIDLNYIGASDRETMLKERPLIENALNDICRQERMIVQHVSKEHAGGSWSIRYQSALGGQQNLKIDLVYMYRIPLWEPVLRDSFPIGSFQAKQVLTLDDYELAAGKLAALLARRTSRDLFDVHELFLKRSLDQERLRLGFILYGAMNIVDWRKVSLEDVDHTASDLESYLLPLLRANEKPSDIKQWAANLIARCKEELGFLFPFRNNEIEFFNQLLDEGEIVPELLTQDAALAERIRHHPDLKWKALNVRDYKGKNR